MPAGGQKCSHPAREIAHSTTPVCYIYPMREFNIHTLKNGIRVVHNRVTNSKIVHCGIMLDVGSRDENTENQGIAHFWEHMAFKGTRKRNSFHILNRLESVG